MVIVWECALKRATLGNTVARVAAEVVRNGEILRDAKNERKKIRVEWREERRSRKATLISSLHPRYLPEDNPDI